MFHCRAQTIIKNSFSFRGVILWNNPIPWDLRESQSLRQFKLLLNAHSKEMYKARHIWKAALYLFFTLSY